MNPALLEMLLDVNTRLAAAGHGDKEPIYADACARLGFSRATLFRKLKEVTMKPDRKRRSDAGAVSLSLEEARRISATLMEGFRANNKKIMGIPKALEILRANGSVRAESINNATGEITPLSPSAVARGLRQYGLHPEQLRRPSPVQALASDHPNDVWQIDASISTLFYVPEGGVEDMSPAVFYKNKPKNFERIRRQRLTRYVITDHCSGSIFLHYVAGGESIAGMADAFLTAIGRRDGMQMYGVCFHLMMDPGAGDTAAFKNLLRRLGVTAVVNAPGNPRAKGQVECAHNIVECDFESGFKLTHVPSIEWINAQASRWMRWFNSTKVHSRTGVTRWTKWVEITAEQLRIVDAALARKLLTHEPETRKVNAELQVEFDGGLWSVKSVPNVMVGESLNVTWNPFHPEAVFIVDTDADGKEVLYEAPRIERDANGFIVGAARIGREIKSQPDTQADTNRKLLERLATGAETDRDAAAARKAKAVPFGGSVDPYKHLDDVPDVPFLPRRGTELMPGARAAAAPAPILTHFEAARALRQRGVEMSLERNQQIAAWYPSGVPEDQLDALQSRLTTRAGLRVVGE